LPKTVFIT